MALTYRIENRAAGTTFDLLDANHKRRAGTRTVTPNGNGTYTISEVLAFSDTESNMQTAIKTLRDLLNLSRKWHHDKYLDDNAWVREMTANETAKRAFIHSYELTKLDDGALNSLMTPTLAIKYALVYTRGEWESAAVTTVAKGSTINVNGGVWDLSGTTGGTIDARIETLMLESSPVVSNHFNKIWIGIRPPYEGLLNFDPIVHVGDDFSNVSGTTSDATPPSDSISTNSARVDFSSAGDDPITERMLVQLGTHSSNEDEHVGSYAAVMRYQINTGTDQLAVQLKAKQGDVGAEQVNEMVYLDSANAGKWHYVALGTVDIPGEGWRQATQDTGIDLHTFRFILDTARISGSATIELHIDVIVLVPLTHFIFIDEAESTLNDENHIITHENMKRAVHVVKASNGQKRTNGIPEFENWVYPHEGGKLVVCADRKASQGSLSSSTFLSSASIGIHKRWQDYHG